MEAVHEVLAILRDISESSTTQPRKSMLGDHQNIRKSPPPATADDALRLKWCVDELERLFNSNLFKRRGSSLQISDEEQKLVAAAKKMDRGSNHNVGDWILTYMDNRSTVENIAQQVHRDDHEDKNSIKQSTRTNTKPRTKSLPNINRLGMESFDLDAELLHTARSKHQSESPSNGGGSGGGIHKGKPRRSSDNDSDIDNGMVVERMPSQDLRDHDDVDDDDDDDDNDNEGVDSEAGVFTNNSTNDNDYHTNDGNSLQLPTPQEKGAPFMSEANLRLLHLMTSDGGDNDNTFVAQRRVSTDSQINRGHLGYGLGVGEEDHTVASRTRLTASTQDVNDVPFANEMQDTSSNPSSLNSSPSSKRLSFTVGASPRPSQTSPLRRHTHSITTADFDDENDNNNNDSSNTSNSCYDNSGYNNSNNNNSNSCNDNSNNSNNNNDDNNNNNSNSNNNNDDDEHEQSHGCHALCKHANKYNESVHPAQSAMPRSEVKRYLCGESLPKYANVINEFNEILLDVNEWNVDIFRLSTLTDAPLALLAIKIFDERNLFDQLSLDRTTVINFFWRVEESYRHYPEIKFHNNMHAADVMHSAHFLLASLDGAFSDIEVFSAIVAAAVHDCQHFGRTNNFLMKTRHKLTMIYNDQSVLEMYHLSEAFKVVGDPTCDIFANFTQDEYLIIRKLVIDMVLSTDMAKHAKFLGEFRALQHDLEENFDENPVSSENRVIAQLSESFSNRVLVLCAIVHNADLGNPTKKWVVCRTWAERLLEEFFEEGDAERELGLPLGALNDRNGVVASKSQVGFLTYVVSPLWQAWSDYVNKFDGEQAPQLEALSENLKNWKEVAESTTVSTVV